jgi:AraC-like DNA-binding protein
MNIIRKIISKLQIVLKNNIVINSRWGKHMLLVLFVGVGIGVIILSVSNHFLRKEMNTQNQAFVNTFANNMDSVLTNNNQSVYQITTNSKIMSFVSDDFPDARDLIIGSTETSSSLKNIVTSNYWVDNILIYSSKNGRIADISSSSPIDNYYSSHINDSMPYETFLEKLNSNRTYVDFYLDNTQYIANIQKKRNANCYYTIVLLMNPNKIFENFIYSDFSQYGMFAMLYKDNNAFLYSNGNIIYKEINADYQDYVSKHSGANKINFDGKKYLVTRAQSHTDYFVYLFMDDYNRTASIIKIQILLIIILTVLSTLISGMYIYKYTSANFKKIHEILYSIQPEIISDSDLMNLFEKQVSNLLEHKNIAEEKLAEQSKTIISYKVKDLLHSPIIDSSSLIEELQDLGVAWDNNCFIVLGFYILNYGEFEDADSRLFNNAYNMCQFVLQNIFEELISQKFTTVFTRSDNLLVSVVNIPEANVSTTNSLISLLKEGISVISDAFQFKYVISLSEAETGIENLSRLYSHMIRNFENITSDDESGTIYRYSDEVYGNSDNSSSKEFNVIETHLYNTIKAKDFDKAIEYISQFNKLFGDLQKSNNTQIYLLRLSSTLASSLSAVVDDKTFNSVLNDIVIKETLIIPYEYLDKIKKLLSNIKSDYFANTTAEQQAHSENELSEKVNKYILANISRNDLSIPMICEYMNISSRTLSEDYKAQTGTTMSKYIQTSRVELAKKLLLETDLSINEIAEQVGYDYALSFTRLFKKYEQVSPSEYRQINKRI